ncbi:TetR/AcrR family transcriptional regulator [Arthrobacter sp.]|uniref:TetR/AcrR family transcriptional regulator n=1 Tax=Arthrobacter sp. TaxID=1667 RepID=UPI0034E89082
MATPVSRPCSWNSMARGESQSTPDLRSKRVAQTEAQIIAAAAVLFLDQGCVAPTLAQIAVHAGVAARTVYIRFGTKAELFKRVVDGALVGDTEPVDVAPPVSWAGHSGILLPPTGSSPRSCTLDDLRSSPTFYSTQTQSCIFAEPMDGLPQHTVHSLWTP